METDPKAARVASLKDALEGTETDVPLTASAVKAEIVDPAPVAAPAGMLELAQALAAALNSNQSAQTDVLKQLLEAQLKMAANPGGRHSNSDEENPRKSVFNIEGERARPRPGLKCHMYFGQYDEDGKVDAAYPIIEDSCTYDEQMMLNQLKQGRALIERNDDKIGEVLIQTRTDGAGKLNRLIIAYPYGWMSKEFQTQLPPMKRLLKALLEQQPQTAAA